MTTEPYDGNRARVEFIKGQLQSAQLYWELAQQSNGNHRLKRLRMARTAHNNVVRYMLRAELRDEDFAYITANAERLKFALDALEAQTDGHNRS